MTMNRGGLIGSRFIGADGWGSYGVPTAYVVRLDDGRLASVRSNDPTENHVYVSTGEGFFGVDRKTRVQIVKTRSALAEAYVMSSAVREAVDTFFAQRALEEEDEWTSER